MIDFDRISSVRIKTLFVVVMVLVGMIVLLLVVNKKYFSNSFQKESASLSVKNKMDLAKQYVETEDISKWKVFENKDFLFTFKYPSGVEIENRLVKSQKVVAVNIRDSGRRYTILKFEIRDKKPSDSAILTSRTGQDSDNNQILEYTIPIDKSRTLMMIGMVFPSRGSNYKYSDLINKIMDTLVIKTK